MRSPTKDEVCAAASSVAFGAPLVQNNLRAIIAEVIVGFALQPDWKQCSGDWNGWDFEHIADGTPLEVKQSALRQTWTLPESIPRPRFDIAPRTGYYEGADWTAQPGRNARIYVFGIHPLVDDPVDHRDATQWHFYVIRTSKLPLTKTIGVPALNALSALHTWGQLFEAVERERIALTVKAHERN